MTAAASRSSSFATTFRLALVVFAMSFVAPPTATVEGLSSSSSSSAATAKNRFVGFDLGTSGARMSIIEPNDDGGGSESAYKEVHSDAIPWTPSSPYDDASAWTDAVETLLSRASEEATTSSLLPTVRSICVSGTSASCLVIDSNDAGKVTRPPRMYDFDVASSGDVHGVRATDLLDEHAPPRHTVRANTGSLAKLLRWNDERPLRTGEALCHQSDYVSLVLTSDPKRCGSGPALKRTVTSDWHNCLKLGYDVKALQWPSWLIGCLEDAGISDPVGRGVVPSRVVSPGEPFGTISSRFTSEFGLPEDCVVVGGTTDSNAAFFAAVGGTDPPFGTAVTSLGSTLAIKQLSRTFVEDADRGVYSHRFPVFGDAAEGDGGGGGGERGGEAWLVGGASNVGCAVLRQQGFTNEELRELSETIDPNVDSPLSYYPLTKRGERFPVADSSREPLLEPKPSDRTEYLHGILQGIGDVEREGFRVLGELGADPGRPGIVWSCGGGAKNDVWLEMRERRLSSDSGDDDGKVVVRRAPNTEASFGAAILAAATFR